MNRFLVGVSLAAFCMPATAWAQSTGSTEFNAEGTEEEEVIVTGRRVQDVGGVQTPDAPKARVVLTEELIRRQNPGQTVNEIINLVPSVSFQNNDPYGSSGGTLSIRGFDSTRISQTFDGVPLNDTGNYAIYSNQQLDPELIEQVNVNLGTTDVDSPTASAVGGTVNYRTRIPGRTLAPMAVASVGEYDFRRIFGMVDVGEFTPFGTRGFIAASRAVNENPFNGFGRIRKQQYNARLFQDIGSNGDFVSLSGHYNQNRNNFGGSVPLRTDLTQSGTNNAPRVVGAGSGNRFPLNKDERFYDVDRFCSLDTPQAGVADAANSCATSFDFRFNPSNTGNIRGASRLTLADNLTLFFDPSFQYVKANGGGTTTASERACLLGSNGRCGSSGTALFGYIGGRPYSGTDLNGDGDLLDTVTVIAPSQTRTRRFGVISSLAYDFDDSNRVRLAYTFDRGRHRQTGEVGFIDPSGQPLDVFPINDPVIDANGNTLQKRDRLSFAILHQVAAQYRGSFFDDTLVTELGVRAPFFTRELNQNCFTTSASGFVDCFGGDETQNQRFANARTGEAAPQRRTYKYDSVLPNLGLTYKFTPGASLFASYARGLQVPGTDPLYDSLFFSQDAGSARPDPETSDNFDLGFRYRTGRIQAQISGFFNKYQNRLASAYDPELDEVIFRNIGDVDKYGVDGSVAFQPTPDLLLYVFGSLLESEIKEDLATETSVIETGGKTEAGAPNYTFGGRIQGNLGPVEVGIQAKRTGRRFINDENLPVFSGGRQVFGRAVGAYTLVDLDARLSLAGVGLRNSYFQVNVFNLLDEFYVGGFGGVGNRNSVPFVQIGAPRAVSASLVVGL